jgi:hypothetical protein
MSILLELSLLIFRIKRFYQGMQLLQKQESNYKRLHSVGATIGAFDFFIFKYSTIGAFDFFIFKYFNYKILNFQKKKDFSIKAQKKARRNQILNLSSHSLLLFHSGSALPSPAKTALSKATPPNFVHTHPAIPKSTTTLQRNRRTTIQGITPLLQQPPPPLLQPAAVLPIQLTTLLQPTT